jgi:glucose-6-phosphate dehydrogenase assembly protein OpcA
VEAAVIVDLPETTTKDVGKKLIELRNSVGAMAMGRVLTLLVVVGERGADEAVSVANDATRQHPARIIVLVSGNGDGQDRLDAQIRVGGDAGASEIIVLRLGGGLAGHGDSVVTPLLLPDSPIVGWWPGDPPEDVAGSPLGRIALRRITDAQHCSHPGEQLQRRSHHYRSGDTDLTWTRITRWRALLAAALDHPPYESVTSATVTAEPGCPSADLLAGWLGVSLRTPVHREEAEPGTGLVGVRLERSSGAVELVRLEGQLAALSQPGQPTREVALLEPGLPEALAAELRRLDADEVYARSLCQGLSYVDADSRVSSQVRVGPDAAAVAAAVASAALARLEAAVESRGIGHLVLTGGSMGAATVRALADISEGAGVWRDVHIWWGDERFVPEGDPERNDQQAVDAGLDRLGVPSGQVHRVPAGEDPDELAAAAADYAEQLAAFADDEGDVAVPRFDVLLLGMGPDSHVASLFPGRDELEVDDSSTVPVTGSPKPPPLRVSLTVPALRAARAAWLVVTGEDKAEAVSTVRSMTDDHRHPATWVRGSEETVWWLDEAAAGELAPGS